MIQSTQNRLTLLFALGITLFCALILGTSYFYLHESLLEGLREDLVKDGHKEYMERYYNNGDHDNFSKLDEDEVFQIYDLSGRIIGQTNNAEAFHVPLNPDAFEESKKKQYVFDLVNYDQNRILVLYFRPNDKAVVRISEPIVQLSKYEQNFLKLLWLSSPGILILAYLLSRILVSLAMRPITEAFRFQENFSSNVTHELHSPLTSLKGNLEVSLRKPRSPEEYREFISLGLQEANRIISLLQDLYLLASSNFKSLSLVKEALDLDLLLGDTLKDIATRLEAKSLTVFHRWEPGFTLFCDPHLFGRAFVNLLDNAVKYSVEGSEIRLEAENIGNLAKLTLTNQSRYLKGEDPKKLLTPFYRGRNTESFQSAGKGLGLNITNYIVLSHGGKLRIQLEESGKFAVEITLPTKGKSLQLVSL